MMKLETSRYLVVGSLTLGLAACAASAPKEASVGNGIVAEGPIGPAASASASPTDPLPPDVQPDFALEKPPNPITEKAKEEAGQGEAADLDEGMAVGNVVDGTGARGASDPLASNGPSLTSRGSGDLPGSTGIASNAKGGRPGATGGSAMPSGSPIGAASEVRGSIDKGEIQRVIKAHVSDVKRCYDQGLQRRPDLEGKVVVKFTIGKTGTVVAAIVQESSLNDKQTEQCIAGAAMKWTFPKPTGEGIVTLSYPFLLRSGA